MYKRFLGNKINKYFCFDEYIFFLYLYSLSITFLIVSRACNQEKKQRNDSKNKENTLKIYNFTGSNREKYIFTIA